MQEKVGLGSLQLVLPVVAQLSHQTLENIPVQIRTGGVGGRALQPRQPRALEISSEFGSGRSGPSHSAGALPLSRPATDTFGA